MSEAPGPWNKLTRHEATGRQARWRNDDITMRANFEYSVTLQFEVLEADGTCIASLSHRMDWENSTFIMGAFNDDGTEIHLYDRSGFDLSKKLALPAPSAEDTT